MAERVQPAPSLETGSAEISSPGGLEGLSREGYSDGFNKLTLWGDN